MAEENQTPETEEKVENQEAEVKAEEAAQAENAEAENAEAENAEAENVEAENVEAENAAEEPKEPTLEEKYAALEKENAELKDQLLRRAADFDNYRKRMIKEKAETAEYANSNLLADLLDSLDNFDRTVDAAATATDPKAIADGIKMINGSLVKMLEDKYGLTAYGKEGDEFNPDEHEAIGRMEEEGVEKETLKQIYLKGYKLKDRIIRNAKVMVSVPKA